MMSHVGNGYLEYTYLKYINLETKYQNHSYKSVTIDMHVVTTWSPSKQCYLFIIEFIISNHLEENLDLNYIEHFIFTFI